MSRDRGVCPGIFAPALVPGQRDNRTSRLLETLVWAMTLAMRIWVHSICYNIFSIKSNLTYFLKPFMYLGPIHYQTSQLIPTALGKCDLTLITIESHLS